MIKDANDLENVPQQLKRYAVQYEEDDRFCDLVNKLKHSYFNDSSPANSTYNYYYYKMDNRIDLIDTNLHEYIQIEDSVSDDKEISVKVKFRGFDLHTDFGSYYDTPVYDLLRNSATVLILSVDDVLIENKK